MANLTPKQNLARLRLTSPAPRPMSNLDVAADGRKLYEVARQMSAKEAAAHIADDEAGISEQARGNGCFAAWVGVVVVILAGVL